MVLKFEGVSGDFQCSQGSRKELQEGKRVSWVFKSVLSLEHIASVPSRLWFFGSLFMGDLPSKVS